MKTSLAFLKNYIFKNKEGVKKKIEDNARFFY